MELLFLKKLECSLLGFCRSGDTKVSIRRVLQFKSFSVIVFEKAVSPHCWLTSQSSIVSLGRIESSVEWFVGCPSLLVLLDCSKLCVEFFGLPHTVIMPHWWSEYENPYLLWVRNTREYRCRVFCRLCFVYSCLSKFVSRWVPLRSC